MLAILKKKNLIFIICKIFVCGSNILLGIDISEISYNNLGKRDGIWKVWNHKGELSAIMIYDSGNRIGNWKSLEKDGQIVQTVNY